MSSEKEAGQVLTSENAAEFYGQKLNLAVEPEPVAEDQNISSEPEQEPEQSESEVKDEAKPTEERKQNPKLEKRFSEITKQREEARKEAQREREARERLESELAEFRRQAAPAPKVQAQPNDGKPDPSKYSDAFKFAEDLANWTVEQRLSAEKKAEADRRANEERISTVKSFQEKLAAAKAELPDFDTIVGTADVVVPDHVRDAIYDSDVGPKLLYALAEDQDLARRISAMNPVAAMREIGKLEAKFETQTQAPVSKPVGKKAPEPIEPIRSGRASGPVVDSEGRVSGSFADYKAARKAGKIR
jgi:hypothetical protein